MLIDNESAKEMKIRNKLKERESDMAIVKIQKDLMEKQERDRKMEFELREAKIKNHTS